MPGLHRSVLILATVTASWLGMQLVHELGHCVGAWLTGGEVARVVLEPLGISRTDLAENPQPLLVAWAGPLGGVFIPLGLWLFVAANRASAAFLLRFFAGFCLMANGLYIGLGSLGGIGDCGDMLSHGAQPWHLWLFGTVTTPFGLYLWHNQGRHFGLGRKPSPIHRAAVFATFLTALGLLLLFIAL